MAQVCPFRVIPHRPVVEMSQYKSLEQYLSTGIEQVEAARPSFAFRKTRTAWRIVISWPQCLAACSRRAAAPHWRRAGRT